MKQEEYGNFVVEGTAPQRMTALFRDYLRAGDGDNICIVIVNGRTADGDQDDIVLINVGDDIVISEDGSGVISGKGKMHALYVAELPIAIKVLRGVADDHPDISGETLQLTDALTKAYDDFEGEKGRRPH